MTNEDLDPDAIEALTDEELVDQFAGQYKIHSNPRMVANLKAGHDEILRRVRRAGTAPGSWQDISTAPNGVLVLALMSDGSMGVMYGQVRDYHGSTPIFWTPLPVPPQLAPPEEGEE